MRASKVFPSIVLAIALEEINPRGTLFFYYGF